MAEQFFRARAFVGDLLLVDLHDWEPWERSRIAYRDEAEVRWLMRARASARRIIRTAAELDAAINDSTNSRSIDLYVHESLLDEARSRWESMKQRPGRGVVGATPTPQQTA
jgi:hypothetical protein